MGKRVILNRSGQITAARRGADPINTLNTAPVSVEVVTARAEAAEAKVLAMGTEVANLLITISTLTQDNDALEQDLDDALKMAVSTSGKVTSAQTKTAAALKAAADEAKEAVLEMKAAERRADAAENKLKAAEKKIDALEVEMKAPAKRTPTKKPATRKKKSSSS